MSSTLYKIVFEGNALPGFEPGTAKANLAGLFNTDLAAIDKLFTGRKVALKRNLPHADAQTYLDALLQAGVDARIEAEEQLGLEPIEAPIPAEQNSPYATPQARVDSPWAGDGPLKVFTTNGRIGRVRYLGCRNIGHEPVIDPGLDTDGGIGRHLYNGERDDRRPAPA
jgi:hypothetical protein